MEIKIILIYWMLYSLNLTNRNYYRDLLII
nr:MAG TPA: hypothetical protein [Bacteriophage sp.]